MYIALSDSAFSVCIGVTDFSGAMGRTLQIIFGIIQRSQVVTGCIAEQCVAQHKIAIGLLGAFHHEMCAISRGSLVVGAQNTHRSTAGSDPNEFPVIVQAVLQHLARPKSQPASGLGTDAQRYQHHANQETHSPHIEQASTNVITTGITTYTPPAKRDNRATSTFWPALRCGSVWFFPYRAFVSLSFPVFAFLSAHRADSIPVQYPIWLSW